MRNFIYGVDVGGTAIKIGLFTCTMQHIEKIELDTPKEDHDTSVFNTILAGVNELNQKHHLTFNDIAGIGVAVPCPIKDGYVERCPNLAWYKIDLTANFRKYVPEEVKIKFANDANIAALGERSMLYEAYQDVVMVTLGTGVGGGIILGGHMLEGASGFGGEIGHMLVFDPKEVDYDCGCGSRGCLEQIAGTKAILTHVKSMCEIYPDSILNRDKVTVKDVFDAAKNGDKAGLATFNRVTDYLAKAFAMIAMVIEPEVFIIGGGISKAGNFLLDTVKDKYQKLARFETGKIKFALAVTGNNAGIIGAALMIKES